YIRAVVHPPGARPPRSLSHRQFCERRERQPSQVDARDRQEAARHQDRPRARANSKEPGGGAGRRGRPPINRLGLALGYTASVASAQRPNLLAAPYTETMTWTDIRAAIDGGKKVIIIPTGGVEQNGPHMTLGKHNDIVTFAAGVLAIRLNGLVAPT